LTPAQSYQRSSSAAGEFIEASEASRQLIARLLQRTLYGTIAISVERDRSSKVTFGLKDDSTDLADPSSRGTLTPSLALIAIISLRVESVQVESPILALERAEDVLKPGKHVVGHANLIGRDGSTLYHDAIAAQLTLVGSA
jgi:hypothetical protein